MGGEGVECHIGDDTQIWKRFFECAHRPLGQPLRVEGLAGIFGFFLHRCDRKQRDGRNAEFVDFSGFPQQFIDAETLDAWH